MDIYNPNDMSILEYTRYHGLSHDPNLESDEESDLNLFASFRPNPSVVEADINDGSQLDVNCDFMKDSFTLDPGAKVFLASVFALRKPRSKDKVDLDVRRSKYLRVEEPLLLTVPELDQKKYCEDRQVSEADFEVELTLWPVHEDKDEGLSWPADFHQLSAHFDKRIKEEKLIVSKDAIELLGQVRARKFRQAGISTDYEADEGYARYKATLAATRPITPPLSPIISCKRSPLSSSPLPIVDSPSWNYDTTPITSPTKDYMDKLLQEDDDLFPAVDTINNLNDLYQPLREKYQPEPCPSPVRRRPQESKLEMPLSPVKSTPLPQSEDLRPPTLPQSETTAPSSDPDLRKIFEEVINPAAYQVQHHLENERFSKVDIMARIRVPTLDTASVQAPWEQEYTADDEVFGLQQLMLPIAQASLHHWSVSKLEKEVPWSVYPANYQDPKIDEDIQDRPGLIEQFIKLDILQCVDRDTLTWKPEGLRILDPDSDDELLEYEAEIPSVQEDLGVVVNHHPPPSIIVDASDTHLHDAPQVLRPDPGPLNMPVKFIPLARQLGREHDPAPSLFCPKGKRPSANILDFSGLLKPSPTTAVPFADDDLSRFMVMQGQTPKRRKLEHIQAPDSPPPPSQATTPSRTPVRQVALPSNLPSRRVIVSPTMIANIPLFRALTQLYPALDVVESQDTGPRSPDIIVSSTSCLILEPLARLHQLPLPGEPGLGTPGHSVHARISMLAQHYNHISVLITTLEATLDARNKKAVDTLSALARGFGEAAVPVFVDVRCVDSSIETLAREMIVTIAVM